MQKIQILYQYFNWYKTDLGDVSFKATNFKVQMESLMKHQNKIWNWAVAFTQRWNERVKCWVPGFNCNNFFLNPHRKEHQPRQHLDIHSLTGLK